MGIVNQPQKPNGSPSSAELDPEASAAGAGLLPGDRPASRSLLIGLAAGTVVLLAAAVWLAAPRPPYRPADVGPRPAGEDAAATPAPAEPSELAARVAVLCEQGRRLAAQGQLQQALMPLLEARRLDPRSAEVRQYLSNVYYMSGQLELALAEVEEALALEPDSPLYRQNAAVLRQQIAAQAPGSRP